MNNYSVQDKDTLICTVASNSYIEGLLVFLYSLQKHFKSFTDYPFIIYFNERVSPLSDSNKKKILKIHPGVNFKHVLFQEDELGNVFLKKPRYLATCLFFQPFLETKYKQILVIDSDMLCVQDFSEILDLNLEGITGIAEYEPTPHFFLLNRLIRNITGTTPFSSRGIYPSITERFIGWRITKENQMKAPLRKLLNLLLRKQKYRINPKHPLNTGIFLISQSVTKKNLFSSFIKETSDFLEHSEDQNSWLGDQTIINLVKHKQKIRTNVLSRCINAQYLSFTLFDEEKLQNVRVFHYTGSEKPWLEKTKSRNDYPFRLWRKYRYEYFEIYESGASKSNQ